MPGNTDERLEGMQQRQSGQSPDGCTDADDQVAAACAGAAKRMTETGLAGSQLRERIHLDPFLKDELASLTGRRPLSRKFKSDSFPGLGAVDVVAERPKFLMELKWSYAIPGKVFESVWDAIKLALLGPVLGIECLYLATGASSEEWRVSESRDLFEDGSVDSLDMWMRDLGPPRGPNYGDTIGADLVIGAHGNQPSLAPASITTRMVGVFAVAEGFELRLISVQGSEDLRPWPQLKS